MTPEERLLAAFAERAGRASVSPDALDHVFRRVARHRRTMRVAAVTGVAASVLTTAVAAALLRPAEDRAAPVRPAPTTVVTPPASTPPQVKPVAPDRAVVAFADGRLVEVSTATGAAVRTITALPQAPDGPRLAWARNRERVYYSRPGCTVGAFDESTGDDVPLGPGRAPAVSSDATRVAVMPCDSGTGIVIHRVAGGPSRRIEIERATLTPQPGDYQDVVGLAALTSVTWWDDDEILVSLDYEGPLEPLRVDVDEDRSLRDGEEVDVPSGAVAGHDGTFYTAIRCCYPEWAERDAIERIAPTHGVLYRHSAPITEIAVDGTGTVLFLDRAGLWRLDGGRARLVVRGAVAVGT